MPDESLPLNAAGFGLERPESRTAREAFWGECAGAPMKAYARVREELGRLRSTLVRTLGGEREGWYFSLGTTAATEALGRALVAEAGGPLKVVTTTREHRGGIGFFEESEAFEVHRASEFETAEEAADRIAAEVRRVGADLVLFSHVTYDAGIRIPPPLIVDRLQGEVRIICDGAQGPGHVLDPMDGVDAYAFSGHKWLGGPMGSGGLYLGERLRHLRLFRNGSAMCADEPFASREVRGTYDFSVVPGLIAAMDSWAEEGHGAREERVSVTAADLFARIDGGLSGRRVDWNLSDGPQTGIITLRIEGVDSDDLVQDLQERGVHVKAVGAAGERHLRFSPDPLLPGEGLVDAIVDRLAGTLK